MGKRVNSVELINQRLKISSVPVRVRQKGSYLYLRATLPPKPGTGHIKPQQYELSLSIPATDDGLTRIEIEAQKLGGLIAMDRFDWSLYMKESAPTYQTVGVLVEQFRKHYLATNDISESTWHQHYDGVYRRMPHDAELTPALILSVVLQTEANTRNRKETCRKLQKLANFAKVTVDLKPYEGGYGAAAVKPREIPEDEVIVEWRDRIPNDSWQWVFGMLATFGLRPHEAFFVSEFIDPHTIRVSEGKTGPRITQAFRPEWAELWNLQDIKKPPCTWRRYNDLGMRCCRQFERYKVPFSPYSLRHAWCIRGTVIYQMPLPVMAALAGHDPSVHLATYNRWISEKQHREVYRQVALGQPAL